MTGATRRAVMLAACLLAAAPPSAARQGSVNGQINGTVLDAARKGAVGLSVAAIPAAAPVIYGTSTDPTGRYGFRRMEMDSYTVVVSHIRGAARKTGIRVRPLFRSIVDFTTPPDAPQDPLPPATPAAPQTPEAEAAAPSSVTIDCQLLDPDRVPVPDAWVILIPMGGEGALRRCRTDPEGACALVDVTEGAYRISARAPGFMSWLIGPMPVKGTGKLTLALTLVPFPMGFAGSLEDLLVPADPIPPKSPPASTP